MAHYIDKDALVAEIERLDVLYHTSKDLSGDLFIQGLFCFLDTSEVKEVDLDKEIDHVWDNLPDTFLISQHWLEFQKVAKHFFELGMAASNKAQKGE